MALIDHSIPSLFNGVSQQPATQRNDSQAELQENAYPTIATGLRKRPPLKYLAKLTSTINSSAAVHVINRSTTEQYAVFVSNGSLQVFSLLDGTPRTVAFPSGTTYLATTDPRADFAFVTVADYTFVLNRSIPVRLGAASAANPVNVGYFAVVLAEPGIIYTATVDGHFVSYTSPTSGVIDTQSIAIQLQTLLSASLGAGYTVDVRPNSSTVHVVRLSGAAVSVDCADGYANTATLNLTKTVTSFSKLPPTFEVGYTVHISGDPSGGSSDYYVAWNNGAWTEFPRPVQGNSISVGTMPWQLVRQSDGTFSFAPVTWADRLVGDDTSNPLPSFINRTISDIYYYRGRLGFLADENVCMSRGGEYYNFFAKSATAVLDTDPIDTNVGTNKVSILKFAVPFNKSLLLFSDQTQFQVTGGQELLTPKTIRADVATEFDGGTAARPVGIGQAVYFGVKAGNNTGMKEYYVDATTLTNDATDITAHVPTYLPQGLSKMAASSSEDVIFCSFDAEPSSVYVYKFYWSGNEKQQSAWSKFTFNADTTVLGMEFINSRCYFVLNRTDGTYLEYMDMQPNLSDGGMGFTVHLDHLVGIAGVYNAPGNYTDFTFPYSIASTGYSLVTGATFTNRGKVLPYTVVGSNIARVAGRWDAAGGALFGQNYTMRYRFSQQYAKDANKNAMTSGKLKLRRFFLDYTDSGCFRVEVQPKARDTYSYPFTGTTLGSSSAVLGSPAMQSGTFKFPVLTSNEGVRIEIINDSWLPSTFQSAAWDAEFVVFGTRS
jgi:hypothetical protein